MRFSKSTISSDKLHVGTRSHSPNSAFAQAAMIFPFLTEFYGHGFRFFFCSFPTNANRVDVKKIFLLHYDFGEWLLLEKCFYAHDAWKGRYSIHMWGMECDGKWPERIQSKTTTPAMHLG